MDNVNDALGIGGVGSTGAPNTTPLATDVFAAGLLGRYRDAYRVAGFLIAVGAVLKWIGIVVPALLILAMFARPGRF